MRVLLSIFAVVAIISAMMLGSGAAFAGSQRDMGYTDRASVSCDVNFNSMDAGNKNYLTLWDFEAGTYGVDGHKGLSPSGNAQSRFFSADTNRDMLLSRGEYCDWKDSRS
jgi:hypothetical protein